MEKWKYVPDPRPDEGTDHEWIVSVVEPDGSVSYGTMRAASPPVSNGELAAEAYTMRNETMAALVAMRYERDTWKHLATSHDNRIKELESYSAALARTNDELRLELAQRPALVPDTPKQGHDWTRVNEGDRRRMGL